MIVHHLRVIRVPNTCVVVENVRVVYLFRKVKEHIMLRIARLEIVRYYIRFID